jgi:hypothetical protein
MRIYAMTGEVGDTTTTIAVDLVTDRAAEPAIEPIIVV